MSIVVSDITKSYGQQRALDGVSFQVKPGEITGFLGPNGAGKSTLMKILTTTVLPDSGTAALAGHTIGDQTRELQRIVGYLPENNPLYEDLYVKEYLHFVRQIHQAGPERVAAVIEQTGLSPEAHKKIGQLSKGYRQRVGLAAALIHDPEVLILDEPTTGLDPGQLIEIRKLIKTLGASKTILMSTHIMQEVEAICDRVIVIKKGQVVADESLKDLRDGQQQQIVVEFDYRVEEVALQQISHVDQVKNTGGFVYELSFSTQQDMRPVIFDFAHDNGLKILAMNPKNRNLESLYLELTQS
ncbi:gliding motility-associated ABC transporter ATP-binding subunit GldA [Croceiramulus getboli]|nr:gliding motility-associated ABC transporter ATP-binding subunit GldA [Flavobacteriaceae bacterium YJPT1-3]